MSSEFENLITVNAHKNQKSIWSNKQIQCFNDLIRKLCSSPCLAFPNKEDTFSLDTDASENAVGDKLAWKKWLLTGQEN